ncbi:MAG: hypothetical protein ACOY3L_15420 [Pseudomonadota bacterium]
MINFAALPRCSNMGKARKRAELKQRVPGVRVEVGMVKTAMRRSFGRLCHLHGELASGEQTNLCRPMTTKSSIARACPYDRATKARPAGLAQEHRDRADDRDAAAANRNVRPSAVALPAIDAACAGWPCHA